MILRNLEKIKIKGIFKFYPNLVCGENKKIYQLTHFKIRRTCYFKEIKYCENRKGYRVNSKWVSKKRLLNSNNYISKNKTIEI